MENSIIILAGGKSERLGREKGLVALAGKPLILHVLERIKDIAKEIIVVVGSEIQKENFEKVVGNAARIVVDKFNVRSPLVGALTGFEAASGEKSLLLSCDTPFISREIASFLLDVCRRKAAAIPRWPDGKIEPLQAAYDTEMGLEASKEALKDGKLDLRSMISKLRGVRYISTLVIREFDPKMLTFFNINTLVDLRKAERIISQGII
ncbi:molybdenum cofactor guanylyltransferase [Candidatus Bathyarchaeota archaeon]|nr:molybdenum cofactor guanylyltransferase [Candidatus Bathyarchaeota archaeon]